MASDTTVVTGKGRRPLSQLDSNTVLVAPSILASDFANLNNEIAAIEKGGADIVHVDVMDGHFVPNLTVGPPVVSSIRGCSDLPFDVHLMISNPEEFVAPFAEAGADNLTIHTEIAGDVRETIGRIRAAGCSAGISVRPKTPASAVTPYLDCVDLVLVMTVEPGFGGQSFQAEMLPKIRDIRAMISKGGHRVHVEVDGGIDEGTAPRVLRAGANVLVAGTSVFRCPRGVESAIRTLKQ